MATKIDTNRMGIYIAEETALKTVDSSVTWYEQEPNDPPEAGADYEYVSSDPINANRQRKKGSIVGLSAKANLPFDVKQSNTQRHMQQFVWADAREKFDTQSLGSAAITITAVDGVNDEYEAASGLDGAIVNSLLLGTNFGVSGNNGLKTVATAAAGAIGTVESLTAESSAPSTARLEVVGHQFPSGDIDVVAGTDTVTFTVDTTDATTLDLNVGEWVFWGGDETATQLVDNGPGYARILSVDAGNIICDRTDWNPVNETGTGLTVQLFFGKFIRNEESANIVRRTTQFESQLGEDDDGVQSQIIIGGFGNEATLNVPLKDKMTMDLSWVCMDIEGRPGATGIKPGTRVSAPCEDFFNTSTDVYVNKIYVHDDTTTNPDAMFGLFTEATININNGVTPNEAITVRGAFEASTGNFEVSATGTAYFTTVEIFDAIAASSDVGWYLIAARENGGIIWDMPLGGASGGMIEGEKGSAITVPIEFEAAASCNGYTLGISYLSYLPDAAMPTQA